MRLLVLGGTKFLGRAVVESALSNGHDVTLFNRGQTNPALFAGVEHLPGDRDGDLSALRGRSWDAVVDTSGYVPRVVRASAELLREAVGLYVFVSSVSVYADFSRGPDEQSPTAELGDHPADELSADYANYGPLKALCEEAVQELFGEHALVVRPGLIVGPHDPTGRFTYWPHRLERGGEILAPGPPDRPAQFVDVRDLAGWVARLCENEVAGVFNAVNEGIPFDELLAGANVTWVSDAFLLEHGVGEWMELPLWIGDPASAGFNHVDVSKALRAGLTFRPLADTVKATFEQARPVDGVGLAAEREAELLEAWRAGR